jgi:hypothetical protein
LLPWKSNKYYIFWVCVCSLIYLPSNGVGRIKWSSVACLDPHIPSPYVVSGTIFEKNIYWTWHECFDFLYNSVWNISNSKKNRARYCYICTYVGLHIKYLLFLSYFNEKLIFSIFSTDFLKYSSIKFHENPSNGNRVVPCGYTDRHDDANSRYTQFCARATSATIPLQNC